MDIKPVTLNERVAVLEYKEQEKEKKLDEVVKKLDELLSLKQKGMGAFWLAASLFGLGITALIQLFFGSHN